MHGRFNGPPPISHNGAVQSPQSDAGTDSTAVSSTAASPTALSASLEGLPALDAAPGPLRSFERISQLPPELLGEIGKYVDPGTRRHMRLAGKCEAGHALGDAAQVATRSVKVTNRNDLARALHIYKTAGLDSLVIKDADLKNDDLKGLPASLRTLTINRCKGITPVGLAHLNGMQLTSLNVSGNRLGDASARVLAGNTTLTSLDVSFNCIREAGAQALARNATLILLGACQCGFGDAGARALARNRTLTSLDVSHNEIGNAGAQALSRNLRLMSLNVRDNEIGAALKQQLRTWATRNGVSLQI